MAAEGPGRCPREPGRALLAPEALQLGKRAYEAARGCGTSGTPHGMPWVPTAGSAADGGKRRKDGPIHAPAMPTPRRLQ